MTRFDRRRLLTSGAAAAVLLGAGVGAQAAPKRGGLLRAVLSGASAADSWDGRGHSRTFMQVAAQGAVFETLTEVAPDGSLRGELLEEWRPREGGAIWDLRLREDRRYHDGAALEAAHVVESLRRHREGGAPVARLVTRARAQGDRVTLRLDRAVPNLPYLLSDPRLVIASDAHIARGVGTGLYRVEAFRPGLRLEARRVADHPRAGRAGWFDEIALSAEDDPDMQERLLRGRQADVADLARIEGEGFTTHRVAEGLSRPGFEGLAPFAGYALTAHARIAVPGGLGALWPMDNARMAERWWMA